MAEFLIYDKSHWMDALTPEQVAEYIKKYPKTFQAKYDARYQRGDIVEVRPDGFYTKTLKGDLSRWPFRVIRVSNQEPNEAFMASSLHRRCKYRIDIGSGKKVETITDINSNWLKVNE